jgi:hypothetical protein
MPNFENPESIEEYLLNFYGSLSEPNYSKVILINDAQPYQNLIRKVSFYFCIQEIGDINYDVSFRYYLASSSGEWNLEISMIGPFALLYRHNCHKNWGIFTEPNCDSEKKLVSLLKAANISLLDYECVARNSSLAPMNHGQKTMLVYNALFSSVPE